MYKTLADMEITDGPRRVCLCFELSLRLVSTALGVAGRESPNLGIIPHSGKQWAIRPIMRLLTDPAVNVKEPRMGDKTKKKGYNLPNSEKADDTRTYMACLR